MHDGLKNSNCVRAFFMFKELLIRKANHFQKNFGVQPQFKAGLHCGKVVAAQIGSIKREIVFNGDVLNTTARIRDECKNYGWDCLVSEALVNRLGHISGFQWEKVDTVTLRGKEAEMVLFGIKQSLKGDKAHHHIQPGS
jgi:adenylate cyclase